MTLDNTKTPFCPLHGSPTKRATCLGCNAAYMRGYLRRRRRASPAQALWERARRRARRSGAAFELPRNSIVIPDICPVLGIELVVGDARSPQSPSLDRILPTAGYVPENVRVVSDQANRLKGDRGFAELQSLANAGRGRHQSDYAKVASYVDRESLLAKVRVKAKAGGRSGEEWAKVAIFLDKAFQCFEPSAG